MRLLHTKALKLTYFVGDAPEYAILSHRWEEEEILFEDVSKIPLSSPDNPARSKLGFAKVVGTCALAANDGYEWVWIDSCCIDKSSSAELQESINSMFRWYHQAQVCYAYLTDVADESSGWSKDFEKSQWFTRGWTLQELLAPSNVEFYSADWSPIGTKLCRTNLLASIIGIETMALEFDWGTKEDSFCAAQKFSWAAHRQVSKVEDSAYCLFGLFNVNMPLLYGEGEEKAFLRLQEAILKETADHTLFLFAWAPHPNQMSMLASRITRFCRSYFCPACRLYRKLSPSELPYSDVIRTPVLSQLSVEDAHYIRLVRKGIMIKLPLVEYNYLSGSYINPGQRAPHSKFVAILPLCRRGHGKFLFGIVLQQVSPAGYIRLLTEPVLLDVNTLKINPDRQGAYTLYNRKPGFFSPGSFACVSAIKIAHFEFFSQSFRAFDWRCEIQHENWVQTDIKANFPLPERQNDRFFLTVSFRNVVDRDMVGAITLWYSMSKVGLHNVVFSQGRDCLARWEIIEPASLSQRCMRIDVPIGGTEDSLRIILRYISVPKDMWSSLSGPESLEFLTDGPEPLRRIIKSYQIEAAYRIHVTHVPKGSQRTITESGPLPRATNLTDT